VKRRGLLAGGAAALAALPARAQPVGTKVVGFLHSGTPSYLPIIMDALRRGLSEQGYVEGRNLRIESRLAAGHYERVAPLAHELLSLKVDAILAAGGTGPVDAFKAATTSVPIVFISAVDPVRSGVVESLGRPGGNITGISLIGASLEPKRLEILGQLVPGEGALCALVNPRYPAADQQVDSLRKAAAAMKRPLEILRASVETEIDVAIKAAGERHCAGLTVAQDPFLASRIPQVVDAARRGRLPAVYWNREFVDMGGLASYGTDFADAFHQAGVYLGRILKGARPADLPVLQASRFELVVNLKAARAAGIEIPGSLVSVADQVIE
jgi:putative ABC transport system substrate-binding protein